MVTRRLVWTLWHDLFAELSISYTQHNKLMLTATILNSSLRGNQLIRALKYAQILIQLLVVVHTACIILFMNGTLLLTNKKNNYSRVHHPKILVRVRVRKWSRVWWCSCVSNTCCVESKYASHDRLEVKIMIGELTKLWVEVEAQERQTALAGGVYQNCLGIGQNSS